MYKVIGGDRTEYGPATAEELRQWIAEGRLNGESQVREEGSTEWKTLRSFAEFTAALHAQAAARPQSQSRGYPSGSVPSQPYPSQVWASQVLMSRPEVQPGRCLAQAWELVTGNWGTVFGATFLIWLIESACQLNVLTAMMFAVVRGIFYGGLYLVILKKIRGQQAVAADAFSGFSTDPGQLLLAGLLTGMLVSVGLFCCLILPGIYLIVAWTFAVPLVADKRLEFWSAMELSRKMATKVWFELAWLLILAFLPYILAWVVMEVKISIALYPTIHDLINSGSPDFARTMKVMMEATGKSLILVYLTKLVLLLNLPFALAAIMYAYEGIFGARTAPTA